MARQSRTRLSLTAILLVISAPSYAYLDPGTGSIILQGIIALIATVGFTAKLYWQRLKAFFKGEQDQVAEQTDEAKQESPD